MCIDNTVSKDGKANYETSIFKVIQTSGYNGAAIVKKLPTL